VTVASAEACRAALQRFAARIAAHARHSGSRMDFDRTLACRITDLDIAFHGQLRDGVIVDLADGDDPAAKLKLTTTSDDLVALVDGSLPVVSAWTSGRVKIDASVRDLLRLRKLL
jgi:hypothetical protein